MQKYSTNKWFEPAIWKLKIYAKTDRDKVEKDVQQSDTISLKLFTKNQLEQ